ncbi:MAG: hypothetical protein IJZ85_12455 [Lachnospiraceae bacterium]|nr:hypothetical protein [Lachnospiraceae bacterium]
MMKAKYPVEPFAIAMIMFTTTMKEATVVGIILLAAACLGCVLRSVPVSGGQWTNSILSGLLTEIGIYWAFKYIGIEPDTIQLIGITLLGLFTTRYVFLMGGKESADDLVRESAIAYGMLMLVAYVRELMGSGTVFDTKVTEGAIVSAAYLKPAFGFVFAGLGLGLTNRILKKSAEDESLWTLVPMVIVFSPYVLSGIPELVGGLVGSAIALVAFMAVRQRLIFSLPESFMSKLPVHLLSMGFIYMIMSAL